MPVSTPTASPNCSISPPKPEISYQSNANIASSNTMPPIAAPISPVLSLLSSIDSSSGGWSNLAIRTGPYLAVGGGLQRVAEEHRDGHRADATGDGRDGTCPRRGRLEVDVADKPVVGAVHADVDHRRALLDHLARDQARPAHRRDQHVRAAANGGEVTRA